MSMSNATENAALKMFLQGTDPSYRAGSTQYLAAFTADPGESASLTNEATYTGYSRLAITKSTAWTDNGSTFNNAVLMQLPVCTGGTSALTHFAIVDTASGAVNMMISGALGGTLNVSTGIQPQFAPGDLSVTAD